MFVAIINKANVIFYSVPLSYSKIWVLVRHQIPLSHNILLLLHDDHWALTLMGAYRHFDIFNPILLYNKW